MAKSLLSASAKRRLDAWHIQVGRMTSLQESEFYGPSRQEVYRLRERLYTIPLPEGWHQEYERLLPAPEALPVMRKGVR